MIYGYARVSTTDQNLDRQLDELAKYNIDKIVTDKLTGTKVNENLNKLIESLKEDDLLIVTSLDRFGRSTRNNLNIIYKLKSRKVKFQSLKENLLIGNEGRDTMSNFWLNIMSSIAELERDMIADRVVAGMATERVKLNIANRPQSLKKQSLFKDTRFKWWLSHKKTKEVASEFNLSLRTVQNYKKELFGGKQ